MPIHAGTGFIDILPRVSTTAFTGAMNAQLKPAVSSFSQGLKSAFKPLAPIIAGTAAVAIGKMTLDFENAFTRIAAISNATAAQINLWRDAVFELGQATAIAPARLADGLFFLASAGLDANQIFPALEASAKGAAIGMGEMEDLTRTVAQVLNAFPDSGLQAIDVIDTLTAAVRESTAEPEEFATALGRVLPIAAKAGVEIDDLTASLATLSNIGLDVDEGVTGVRQVLNLIVSPGKQATETMNELGIATEDLRDRLEDKGIINTLRFLSNRVGENEDQFRKLLPNIRAMTAAFGLTEQEAAKVDGIFRRVADSTGDLNEALTVTQEGPGFKFQQAMVSAQEAAIRLGQAFLPVGTIIVGTLTAILGPAADLLSVLGDIPDVVTAIFVAFLAYQALKFVPTLLLHVALALERIGATKATDSVLNLAVVLKNLPGPLKLAAVAIGLITFGMKDAENQAKKTEAALDGFAHQLASGELNEKGIREFFNGKDIPDAFQPQMDAFVREAISRSHDLTDAQRELDAQIEKDSDTIQRHMLPAFSAGAEILTSMGTSADAFGDAAVTALHKGDEAFAKFSEGAIKDAATILEDFHDAAVENLNFTVGALGELSSAASAAQDELAAGTDATGEALAKLREDANLTPQELLKAFKDAKKETQDFGRDLLEIETIGGAAGDRVAEALLAMGEGGRAAAETIADAGPKMQESLVRNFAAGEGAAEDLATRLTRRIIGTLNSIRDILEDIARTFGIRVELENGDAAKVTLDDVAERLREIDGTVATATIHVTTVQTREGGPLPPDFPKADGGVIGAAGGGITRRPTILAGEGGYATSFGKGAEGILPLDDHTMGRLGASIAKQIHLPMIVVEADGEAIGRVATKQQRRRRQLVGV